MGYVSGGWEGEGVRNELGGGRFGRDGTTTMTMPLRTTNPLLLNANTAVMAKLTNSLPLRLPLAIPITRGPHFIPRPTRSLLSLLILTLFQHPNDHARTYLYLHYLYRRDIIPGVTREWAFLLLNIHQLKIFRD